MDVPNTFSGKTYTMNYFSWKVFLEITTLKVSCFKQILDNIRKVTEIIRTTEMKPIVPILPFFSFFYRDFLSKTMTILGTAGEKGVSIFILL